jgi:hypothetical protein
MKGLLILLLFFVSMFNLFGQIPEGVKYDQLEYSYDSSSVLITKGKNKTIFNGSANIIYNVPKKNYVVAFPQSNIYAEIPIKGGGMWIHLLTGSGNYSFHGNDSVCALRVSNPFKYSHVEENGKLFDLSDGSYIDSVAPNTLNWGSYKIEKLDGNNYLIQSYCEQIEFMDSQDITHIITGRNGSGVFCATENKWKIEPKYKQIYQLNGYFFCVNENYTERILEGDYIIQEQSYTYTFDIYQTNGSDISLIIGNATQIEPDFIARVLNAESADAVPDSDLFYLSKNDKKSLVHFSLFDANNNPSFNYQTLIENRDFIYAEPFFKGVVCYEEASLDKTELYVYDSNYVTRKIISDPSFVCLQTNDYEQTKYQNSAGCYAFYENNDSLEEAMYGCEYSQGLGIKKINDSLIGIFDVIPPKDIFPYLSTLFPGEDSLDENGYTIYYANTPAQFRSGIFNLSSETWQIPQEYFHVRFSENNIIAAKCFVEDWSEWRNKSYLVLDKSGATLKRFEFEEFYSDYQIRLLCSPFKNTDSIIAGPRGFAQHTANIGEPQSYLIKSDTKYALYNPDNEFNNTEKEQYYDFIYYHPDLNFKVYLLNDSMYFESDFSCNAVSTKGKITFLQHGGYYDDYRRSKIWYIDHSDTLTETNDGGLFVDSTLFTIELIGDTLLLLNEFSNCGGVYCIECFGENGGYNREQQFQTENSCIWKKTNNGWEQWSPYYAGITPANGNRFIAFSGSYYDKMDNYEGLFYDYEKTIPARYFLLDSNLKAIHYMDYYDFAHIEDLGFGFKVKLNEGDKYFFLTYDLEALTNGEWDHFEKENGKLKAIVFPVYELDEIGNLVTDEYGKPIEVVSQTTKYFKFPLNYKY